MINGQLLYKRALYILFGMALGSCWLGNAMHATANMHGSVKQDSFKNHTACAHLCAVQKEVFPRITDELTKGFKKNTGFGISFLLQKRELVTPRKFFFPDVKEGQYYLTYLSRQDSSHLACWAGIIEQLSEQMNNLAKEGKNPKRALPSIDHGRIKWFKPFWDRIYRSLGKDIRKNASIQAMNKGVQNIVDKLTKKNPSRKILPYPLQGNQRTKS